MNRRFVITAGPTREFIDAARFISNPSTGRMGFAVAAAAARRGFETVLVAGPCSLPTPQGVERIDIVSARDMQKAVSDVLRPEDVFIAVAAVADWRPESVFPGKLKKEEMSPVLRLVRNPDILLEAKAAVKIGFAAETGPGIIANAKEKCRRKNLAMIVANDILETGAGFGGTTNHVSFIFPDGRTKALEMAGKDEIADSILDECEGLCV